MFLLAQLGLIISLLLQSEGQSHGCSERLVVAHMGGSWPCLGDNKVLNLHDRYKNFAWGKPQESLGRTARRLSAEGRAWATTAGRSGAWAVGDGTPGEGAMLGGTRGAGAALLSPNASASWRESSPQRCSGVPALRGPWSLLRGALQAMGGRRTATGICRPTPGHRPQVDSEPGTRVAAGLPAGERDTEGAN